MTSNIRVHQIHFRPSQRPHLEPSFVPYDNSKSPAPEQMEYWVFQDNFRRGVTSAADYTGFVSWKFREKTRIPGEAFLAFMAANPGRDVYFINPFPAELVWQNVWLQGDHFHPGLLPFTQRILDRLGYQLRLAELENLSNTAAYCNYWVATPEFWQKYMDFTLPVYHHVLDQLSQSERQFLWQRADREIDASHFPFLFERLFSTLLTTNPSIRALGYRFSAEALRSRYQPQIAEMILAHYHLEDGEFEPASRRLLCSVRGFHGANRAQSPHQPRLLDRLVGTVVSRATSVLGGRRGRRKGDP